MKGNQYKQLVGRDSNPRPTD